MTTNAADELIDALEWYRQMAKRMGAACLHGDTQTMLHLMKELSVDYGNRAAVAIDKSKRAKS